MEQVDLTKNDTGNLAAIPESCGRVALGCSEVAGIVQGVNDSTEMLQREHALLTKTVDDLMADQDKVSQASDEARILSGNAIGRLAKGTGMIQSSLVQVTAMLDLVEALSTHVTGFAAAIEQVRRCSLDIAEIADTTNILALNATIEAMRAGDAGRTFAVVAGEVKGLAADTRTATDKIGDVVDRLTEEATHVIERIETGASTSRTAKTSISDIDGTISEVTQIVEEVDVQNEQITHSTQTISKHVLRVHDVLTNFADQSRSNEKKLAQSYNRMGELELTACDMFDQVVHAGLSPEDSHFVRIAAEVAGRAQDVAETAIAARDVSAEDFFDRDYKSIIGTNPECFATAAMPWAENHWQPLLDELANSDARIGSTVFLDENGHLFAHMSRFSRPPTGDLERDTLYSRSGRIFSSDMNLKAGRSRADYVMSVYRRDDKDADYSVWRSTYMPVEIDGRRWGNLQISYQL